MTTRRRRMSLQMRAIIHPNCYYVMCSSGQNPAQKKNDETSNIRAPTYAIRYFSCYPGYLFIPSVIGPFSLMGLESWTTFVAFSICIRANMSVPCLTQLKSRMSTESESFVIIELETCNFRVLRFFFSFLLRRLPPKSMAGCSDTYKTRNLGICFDRGFCGGATQSLSCSGSHGSQLN